MALDIFEDPPAIGIRGRTIVTTEEPQTADPVLVDETVDARRDVSVLRGEVEGGVGHRADP